mgnify:CR=1 FL=1
MDTKRRFSLRFRLCNLIFRDELRQAMAFGILELENTLRYSIYNERLDDLWIGYLYVMVNDLSHIVYGLDHRLLEYDENGNPTNSTTSRFKLCNLLYRGKLEIEIIWAIYILNSMLDYLKTNHYRYDTFISCGVQCIIGTFERVMYRDSGREIDIS